MNIFSILFLLGFVLLLLIIGFVGAKVFTFAIGNIIKMNNTNDMTDSDDVGKSAGKRLSRYIDSMTMRTGLVALLIMLLLIPLGLVTSIVHERGYRHDQVLTDIASTWGRDQTIVGPVLTVPFTEMREITESVTDEDGKSRLTRKQIRTSRMAYFLPDKLDIDVTLDEHTRSRGIFESLVYSSDVSLQANFGSPDLAPFSQNIETISWDKATLVIGLSDTRAIDGIEQFLWQGQQLELSPGTGMAQLNAGFHAKLPEIDNSGAFDVALNMTIKGSGSMSFAPSGETTRVSMQSGWPHPSFTGSSLPDTRDISEHGFTAQWEIPHIARNYPQSFSSAGSEVHLLEFVAGVSMFEPVSLYSQITRATKYGVLFIVLTFMTLLVFEISIATRMHIAQYGLVGVSLVLFFLVLLSLSEHIAFLRAYAVSAGLTIVMITSYVGAALRSARRAGIVCVVLTGLYGVLYTLLQLQDFALLLGTALVVFSLIVMMFVTRNLGGARKKHDAAAASIAV